MQQISLFIGMLGLVIVRSIVQGGSENFMGFRRMCSKTMKSMPFSWYILLRHITSQCQNFGSEVNVVHNNVNDKLNELISSSCY